MRRALTLTLALAACAPWEDRSPPATPRVRPSMPVFTPPAGFERLRFGLTPFLAEPSITAAHTPLAQYLSRALSVPVEVVVGASYGDALDRLQRGEFDLVGLGPYAFVLATQRVKLRCLVQTLADGSATTSAAIFVRDDSPRRTVADLRGASLAFVDPLSSTGYLFARQALLQHGLDPAMHLGRTEFAGSHEAVVLAVLEGRVEAGATSQGTFGSLKRARGVDPLSFRVLARSTRIPRDVLCVRADLPEVVTEAVTRALLALDGRQRAGREILGPINLNGFQPLDEGAYDGVRRAAAELPLP